MLRVHVLWGNVELKVCACVLRVLWVDCVNSAMPSPVLVMVMWMRMGNALVQKVLQVMRVMGVQKVLLGRGVSSLTVKRVVAVEMFCKMALVGVK